MLNNTLFVLDSMNLEERTAFGNAIRSFFAIILRFVYKFFSGAIDLLYDLATFTYMDSEYINSISERIFNILIIFMLFKISFSVLNYLVNPDLSTDKDKGFQGIIKRVIISIILLISINPIFSLLKDVQNAIISDDIITSIFADSSDSKYIKIGNINLVGIRMNENCPDNKKVYTVSSGDRLSLLLFRSFLQPYNESDIKTESDGKEAWNAVFDETEKNDMSHYCGYDISNLSGDDGSNSLVLDSSSKSTEDNIKSAIPGPNSAEGFLIKYYYNLSIPEAHSDYAFNGTGTGDDYFFDFNYIFALICGFVALLISISFCFDVVIRSLNLIVLQILAPIPIISYVSPQGKSSEILGNWLKKVLSVWASLFIKIITLTLAITLITEVCENISENIKSSNASTMMQIFIILGILMFAKKLPSLLEELIPGLKLSGGFELNPLKRISKDALYGNAVLGAGATAGALGLAGVTNFAHRTGSFIKNKGWQGENGKFSLRKTAGGLGKIAESTAAGATRAGLNAFGRTSKDGKLFAGAWGGYQTSMFSKLQREDNLRKAGLENASLFEKAKFSVGSAFSDAARYTGVLNKGQREYLNAARQDEIIKDMEERKAQEKYERLEPLQTYSKHAQRIKERIENSKDVKDAQTELDDALASGDLEVIANARKKLDLKKAEVSRELFKNDAEIKDLTNRMSEIRKQNVELQAESYNFQKADGTFDSSSIYNTASFANTIELEIENKDIYDVERYKRGDATVVAAVNREYNNGVDLGNYIENHNENSIAKLQNSSRMNKDIQQPGFKPSSGPVQQKAFDNYAGGHPGNGNPQGGGIPNRNPRGGGRPH